MSDLRIALDERGRLAAAVLAASDWPGQEQAQETHAVHPHAKQTRQFVMPWAGHDAVMGLNAALAAGTTVDTLLTAVFRTTLPDFTPQEPLPTGVEAAWLRTLADFATTTAVADFWEEHALVWQEALSDLSNLFHPRQLPDFIGRLAGQGLSHRISIMPNLVYPALSSVLAPTNDTLYLLLPPPKAVGESPPWPFREGPDWALAEACYRLFSFALTDIFDGLGAAQRPLLMRAAITLFLEEALDETYALAYMVRCKKQFNLPGLPAAVAQLRDHLQINGRSLAELTSY